MIFPKKCYLVSTLMLPFGCSAPANHSAWTSKDSWYHTPQTLRQVHQGHELKFYEVPNATQAEAEKMLQVDSVIALSRSQAQELMKGKYLTSGKMPYLVRAVYLNRGTGAFSVAQEGRNLFVSHGSLGHSAVPMKRQALIVDLSQIPKDVFVTCGMAE